MSSVQAILRFRWQPWFLSISTGILLVLVFPKFNLTLLGWVALAPLLAALDRAPGMRRALALGWVAGLVFFGGTLYWIPAVLLDFGHLGRASAAGAHLLLLAVLALFLAAFAAAAWLLLRRLPESRVLWGIPALWVALELARAHLFTGFPWLLLGYALADHALLAQLARLGGVYLLSFVLALLSTGILLLFRHPSQRRGMLLAAALFAVALATAGSALLPSPPAPETAYLVQAQVPLEGDWTAASFQKIMSELEARVVAAYARNLARSGLVVWPEMPAPLYYPDDELLRARLHSLARQTQSPMLVSVVAYADAERRTVFNSAVLVGASGDFQGRYDKIHLVPFGEYVPLRRLFFFMEKITAEVGDFRAGERASPLGSSHPLAPLICYENIFPDLVRQFSARGAQVLVNISNDGWYGDSAAREQLLLMSRLRAVENNRWLLRATNTGITAVVDPCGRVRTFAPDRRAVFAAGFGYRAGTTLFVAFGHWFSWLAAGAALVLLLEAARERKNGGVSP